MYICPLMYKRTDGCDILISVYFSFEEALHRKYNIDRRHSHFIVLIHPYVQFPLGLQCIETKKGFFYSCFYLCFFPLPFAVARNVNANGKYPASSYVTLVVQCIRAKSQEFVLVFGLLLKPFQFDHVRLLEFLMISNNR